MVKLKFMQETFNGSNSGFVFGHVLVTFKNFYWSFCNFVTLKICLIITI